MIGGLREGKLAPRRNVKVRSFPGATINDMKDYIRLLLKKRPFRIIVHAGTNDAVNCDAAQIIEKLVNFKDFIKSQLDVQVIISSPINRLDNAKLATVIRNVNAKLDTSGLNLINNNNITSRHLGKAKLHLNVSGTTQLARNILNKMKSF